VGGLAEAKLSWQPGCAMLNRGVGIRIRALLAIVVAAASHAAYGCSSQVACNGFFGTQTILTFPCDELVAVVSTCAYAGQSLPRASPVQILLSPDAEAVSASGCHITFEFRSGATYSADVVVGENSGGCDEVTASPSMVAVPLSGSCAVDAATD
jgi:hypothetical protein